MANPYRGIANAKRVWSKEDECGAITPGEAERIAEEWKAQYPGQRITIKSYRVGPRNRNYRNYMVRRYNTEKPKP